MTEEEIEHQDALLQIDEAVGDVFDAYKDGDMKREQVVDMFSALFEQLYAGEKHNLINFLNIRPYRHVIKRHKDV